MEEIKVPPTLYDQWFSSYQEYLKLRYPDDVRQLFPMSQYCPEEHFIFRGILFCRAGKNRLSSSLSSGLCGICGRVTLISEVTTPNAKNTHVII